LVEIFTAASSPAILANAERLLRPSLYRGERDDRFSMMPRTRDDIKSMSRSGSGFRRILRLLLIIWTLGAVGRLARRIQECPEHELNQFVSGTSPILCLLRETVEVEQKLFINHRI
jgi:hypothetical protein